jgi:hypothetical protein
MLKTFNSRWNIAGFHLLLKALQDQTNFLRTSKFFNSYLDIQWNLRNLTPEFSDIL